MGLAATKVQIHGASQRGIQQSVGRSSPGTLNQCLKDKGVKATVSLVHNGVPKTVNMRVDDMPETMLQHTLLTGFDNQGFVQPRDMRLVSRIIRSIPQVMARLLPIKETPIDWAKLPFDLNMPEKTAMFFAKIKHGHDAKGNTVRGKWEEQNTNLEACLFPFSDVLESPAAQVKHYGQACFEGIKVFRQVDGKIIIFRLRENALRLQRSARRLGMTPASIEFYMEAIRTAVLANKALIPPPGFMAAMYIRPVQYGSGPRLGVKEAGEETLMIFVSPVGPYYAGGEIKPIDIRTPKSNIRRSGEGLTGGVKAAGNYVMGLIELILAKEKGFKEILWVKSEYKPKFENNKLSLEEILYPEEIGSSNLFYVIDGELYTPELTDTILPGITRDSVIKLARALGIKVHEAKMPLAEVLARASEVFCTGTAAVITPVGSITHKKLRSLFNNGKIGSITQLLYSALVALQEGRFDDPALEDIRPDLLEEFKADWIYVVER